MIASVRGEVLDVALDHVVIEAAGVGYKVMATPSTLATLHRGGEARLITAMIVREDSMTLYGFPDGDARDLFLTLLGVSGIGPKIALATLAVLERIDAIAQIQRIGGLLVQGLAEQARRHGIAMLPPGQPAMPVIRFPEDPDRRRIRRWCSLVTQGGAYAHPAHNWFVSAAHTEEDVARTLEATDAAFRTIAAEA